MSTTVDEAVTRIEHRLDQVDATNDARVLRELASYAYHVRSDYYVAAVANELADHLEREHRPLRTVVGSSPHHQRHP